MPGSNPVFGLNSLGGALSIQTAQGKHRIYCIWYGYRNFSQNRVLQSLGTVMLVNSAVRPEPDHCLYRQ